MFAQLTWTLFTFFVGMILCCREKSWEKLAPKCASLCVSGFVSKTNCAFDCFSRPPSSISIPINYLFYSSQPTTWAQINQTNLKCGKRSLSGNANGFSRFVPFAIRSTTDKWRHVNEQLFVKSTPIAFFPSTAATCRRATFSTQRKWISRTLLDLFESERPHKASYAATALC